MNPIELKELASLLDFGAKCFDHQMVNVLQLRGAKKVLFPMVVAAHNYTEGIYSLCRENQSHPCFCLLRSLCDNLINAKFLYCSPRKHCHLIFLHGLIEKRKQLNDALEYLKQHPQRLIEIKTSINNVNKLLKKSKIKKLRLKLKLMVNCSKNL